ncbi:hypothetical protein [Reichenbachiella ulvae]|uniref:Uncharacterized protein n=1 Tax=Reichenbachiella ulvae TaxID=2980104 RepID=A0ABT3CQZ8_9BACT|nr:hypothetical protein [Reichenbachiella ulvae]MCV9385988.1 hypothetical protein [Reichenbachiella ulvae]
MDYILAIISTLFVLLPIFLGCWSCWQKAEGTLRLFVVFLLFGFAIDGMGWYQYHQNLSHGSIDFLRRFYALVEALFFAWFTLQHIKTKKLFYSKAIFFSLILLWMWLEIFIPHLGNGVEKYAGFQAIYRVLISVLSGWVILSVLEEGKAYAQNSTLWFLFGVFCYSLCTFIMMIFQRIPGLAEELWPMHNVINIICYVLFSIGFLLHPRSKIYLSRI